MSENDGTPRAAPTLESRVMDWDSNHREIEVDGILVPAAWDEGGNVVGIAIAAYDEKEYIIRANKIQRELLTHLRKRVRARGRIVHQDGTRTIRLTSYSLLSGKNNDSAFKRKRV
jgi:hypothetical protein